MEKRSRLVGNPFERRVRRSKGRTQLAYVSFKKASTIRRRPLTHERSRGIFSATLLPVKLPAHTAMTFATKEKRTARRGAASERAAPNPTAKPSRESAMARGAASAAERLLEQSLSAFSGLAYTSRIKRRCMAEKEIFLWIPCERRINDLMALSHSLAMPSRNRMEKQSTPARCSGMNGRTREPRNNETPRMALQIPLMTATERKGILI